MNPQSVLPNPSSPEPIPARLAQALTVLRAALAEIMAARFVRAALVQPRLMLLHIHLGRVAARLTRLIGTEIPPEPARPAPEPAEPARTPVPRAFAAEATLPRAWGWVIRQAGAMAFKLNGGAALVQHVLADPDIAALAEHDWRVARVLRGLCRKLGIRHGSGLSPAIVPPPAARRARPKQPRQPRPKSDVSRAVSVRARLDRQLDEAMRIRDEVAAKLRAGQQGGGARPATLSFDHRRHEPPRSWWPEDRWMRRKLE